MFVYLDNSATTKQYSEVTNQMMACMTEDFGNASSLHRMGMTAEKHLKAARKSLAKSLNCGETEIYFNAGGTEGDNTALFGAAEVKKRRGNKIITTEVEHPAVLESCKRLERMGFCVKYIGVDANGQVNLDELSSEIDEKTILVSVMEVNNELGTIQPLREIGKLKQKDGDRFLFHSDGVQSYGKVDIDLQSSPVDLFSLSGHKVHGPKGVGALYVKKGIHIEPYLCGGGQESGMRSGTENIPAIVGLGVAADQILLHGKENRKRMTEVRSYLLEGIRTEISDIRINSFEDTERCVPSVLNISFMGTRGEVLLHTLEQSEIYVSTGSACSSKKKGSHVLSAAGLSADEIEGAIRFSFSEWNTVEEMDYVLQRLKQAVADMRKILRRGKFDGR